MWPIHDQQRILWLGLYWQTSGVVQYCPWLIMHPGVAFKGTIQKDATCTGHRPLPKQKQQGLLTTLLQERALALGDVPNLCSSPAIQAAWRERLTMLPKCSHYIWHHVTCLSFGISYGTLSFFKFPGAALWTTNICINWGVRSCKQRFSEHPLIGNMKT